MAATVKASFLMPIRTSLLIVNCPYASLSCSRTPLLYSARVFGEFRPMKTWMTSFQSALSNRVSRLHWKACMQRYYTRDICRPVCRLSANSILGFSILVGSKSLWSSIAHSMDGLDILVDDQESDVSYVSDTEDHDIFLTLARKLLAPIFLLLVVWMNWDRPVILAAKVILVLLRTKPSSFSVFVFIEKLHRHSMSQRPFYKFKPTYAKKVEVEDYTILRMAKVEFEGKKFTLVGILGSWWILQLPPGQRSSSLLSA